MTETERQLANRKFNEHVRMLASSLNTVAVTTFGAALILPSVTGEAVAAQWIWILTAAGLHLMSHVAIRFLRSED